MLLAAAGVLDGRRATTNPDALDDLRERGTVDGGRGARGRRRRRRSPPARPRAGSTSRCTLLERFGGPGSADAAARELRYERPAGGVLVPGLQPVGERA